MNKTVSVPRGAFAWLLYLIAAMALFLGACQDTAENESGTITIAIGVSPTARWSGAKPTEDLIKTSVTHVIELYNGSDYGTKIRTITLTPGKTSHTETNVPLGALRVEIRATLNGYDFAKGDTEITVASGQNSAPVTMERLEHGIVLSENPGSTHTFTALTQGYSSTTPLSVEVHNYAENATGALTISLSGTGSDSFTLVAPTASITQDSSTTFTVTPKPGLGLGTYTATIEVYNTANGISASFTVSFTVVPVALDVYDADTWNAAISTIVSGGNGKSYAINLTGNFSIAGTTANTFGSVTGLNVTISGNHPITLSGTGNLLRITSGQTVTLKDARLVGLSTNNNMLVYVESGTFNMESGTISGNGGGVNVSTTGATFNMSGGTISDNDGGVYVQYGTFNMTGGTISGNTSYNGGGVNVQSGTFNMEGGTISGNTAGSSGGGVYSGGTFNMTGGNILDNSAKWGGGLCLSCGFVSGTVTHNMSGGIISGNKAIDGGGVDIVGSAGTGSAGVTVTFTMTGGTVTGNEATTNGGGVYVEASGTATATAAFNMTGGTILGNTANGCGGGVAVSKTGTGTTATFDLKSLDLVKDNTANAATNPGKKLYVDSGTFKIDGSAPDPALKDGVNYYWP
jgi:hypothetical protein